MPYLFNPHAHVKIWLSPDKDEWMNVTNRLRLIRMRDHNPKDSICLVYDKNLLSSEAVQNLQDFCRQFRIQPKDVHTDIFRFYRSEEERDLIELYEQEIAAMGNGGNLALASDALRLFRSVCCLGVYTDMDVIVETRDLPDQIPVERPVLFPMRKKGVDDVVTNNDCIAVVDWEAAAPIMREMQTELVKRQQAFLEGQSCYLDRISIYASRRRQIFRSLHELSRGKTSLAVRQYLLSAEASGGSQLSFAQCDDLETASREALKPSSVLVLTRTQVVYYSKLTQTTSTKKINEEQWKKLDLLYQHGPQGFSGSCAQAIEKIAEVFHVGLHNYLVCIEICTGGPRLVGDTIRKYEEKEEARKFYSLEHYRLDQCFHYQQDSSSDDLSNDLYWTALGKNKIDAREIEMATAAQTIQGWWRGLQRKKDFSTGHQPPKFSPPQFPFWTSVDYLNVDTPRAESPTGESAEIATAEMGEGSESATSLQRSGSLKIKPKESPF